MKNEMTFVVTIIFCLAYLFAMLGLGGVMIYIPVFSWFGYDFKGVAIPTGLYFWQGTVRAHRIWEMGALSGG